MDDRSKAQSNVIFIIVNWNRKELLKKCLVSLNIWLPFEFDVIVIDNASEDGSVELVETEFPEVILIENQVNVGFARAVNLGIEYIRENSLACDYVVLLNNDVLLKDGSLGGIFRYLEERPEIVAAVPTVFLEDGRDQTGIGGFELTLANAFKYFFFLSILFSAWFNGFYLHQTYFRKKNLVKELDWASGVCLAVRCEAFAKIKGLSESYFMYAEDVAFGRDLRSLGKIVYYPESQVTHLKQVSEADKEPGLWLDSLFRYYNLQSIKNKKCRFFCLKLIFLAGFWMRWVYFALLRSTKFKNHKKMLQIYYRHIIKSIFAGKAK